METYLKDKAAKHIPGFNVSGRLRITILTEGGSERNFYRVTNDTGSSFIYMKYADTKEENKFYCDIAGLFIRVGVSIAEILFTEDGNIFLEDLGNVHLYNLVTSRSEKDAMPFYERAIGQISQLHTMAENEYKKAPFKISKAFDYDLYRWESGYFTENLIKKYYGLEMIAELLKMVENDFHFLAETLSAQKAVFIHRDCQSKNIMIKGNEVYFIDFQGARAGLPQYDLASLLEDPYVFISEETKKALIECYIAEKSPKTCIDVERFMETYKYCAIQRLMQAQGAYAYLGLVKDKKEFLKFIPNGLCRLKNILVNTEGLKGIKALVNILLEKL